MWHTQTRCLQLIGFASVVLSLSVMGSTAKADVRAPVEITMPADTRQAVSGQEYEGVFEVRTGQPGSLGDVRVTGDDWTIGSVEAPEGITDVDAGTIQIRFPATAIDANQPIALSLSFDGRPVSRRFEVGPNKFNNLDKVGRSLRLPNTTGRNDATVTAGTEGCTCPNGMIRAIGRIIYTRPDGEVVGADRLHARLWDLDPDSAELLWEGYTDSHGYFDTQCRDGDVDGDGSGPDYYLYYFTNNDSVIVYDASDETYASHTDEVEDYKHACFDLGWVMPVGVQMNNAIHISNVVTRAHRYLDELGDLAPGKVGVDWPVLSPTHYDPPAIRLNGTREWEEWDEFTIIRQYGHHFVHSNSTPPFLDYCNGWCDEDQSEGLCGHCTWCPEDRDVAFHEGFANWFADVITRSFPQRYTFDSGEPYDPFFEFAVDTESPGTCGGVYTNTTDAAGFVGMLLRDIEDETQDDHDDDPDPDTVEYDGIYDLMCAGPYPIFRALIQYSPTTVLEFLNAYLARWGYENGDLWATAYNVGGEAYVAGFFPDTQTPGIVQELGSSTHPLGVGGELPCLSIEFAPANDDVSGCNTYSYLATRESVGSMPGEGTYPARPTDECGIRGTIPLFDIGEWYVSIRAQDNFGRWSNDYETFGPFEVLDCNGTGQLDICDIDCGSTGSIGACNYPISPCLNLQGNCVETSLDCNGNLRPDECDISGGQSEDCNRDGIPDDCQTAVIKHYEGNIGVEWELVGNWRERVVPVDGDHVCIPAGIPSDIVHFREDFRRVTTLNCDDDFRIAGPSAELRIDEPSYIAGDLDLLASSTLRVMESLDVLGELAWVGNEILGPGSVNVFGGFNLLSQAERPKLRNSAHLSILDGGVNVVGERSIELYDTSTFSIGLPVTYSYDGNSSIFAGGTTTIVNVHGSLIRNSGAQTATITSFVLNSGLIHNRSGGLTLPRGSSQSGQLLGDPGTTIRLDSQYGTSHTLLPGSVLAVDDVAFGFGPSVIRGNVNIAGSLFVDNLGACTFTNEAQVESYGRHLVVVSGTARLEAPAGNRETDFESVTIGGTAEGSKVVQFNTGRSIAIDRLDLIEGNIEGSDAISVTENFFWGNRGGSVLPGGAITSHGAVTIQSASSARTLRRVFNNAGYATFFGGFNVAGPGAFNNLVTGTVDVRMDESVFSLSTNAVINNDGRLLKSAGNGVSSIRTHFRNTGTVEVRTGTLEFDGNYGLTAIQTAGRTVLDGGNIRVTAPGIFQVHGGEVLGNGTITGAMLNSGGTLKPGLTAGLLNIAGNYTQTATGALEIELGGATPGIDFDRLSVSGAAALGGTLRVELIGGFVPTVGQQFDIVTHASRNGTFAAVTPLTLGLEVNVIYGPTDVTVEIVSAVNPGDCDANGQVTLDDYTTFPACMGGPDTPYVGVGCACLDANRDGGIDLHDLSVFQSGFSD